MTERDDWLNLTMEKVIDPDLPICDAHHHLCRNHEHRYLSADFLNDVTGGHNVLQTVFIQFSVNQLKGPGSGMTPIEETEFVIADISGVKSAIDVAAGIVGFADLTLGDDVTPILEAHLAAGKNRFRGIRFTPPRGRNTNESQNITTLLLEPNFQEGFANLRKYDLSYDVMVRHHQWMELADLAVKFPETPIIVNHIGWRSGDGQYEKQHEEKIKEWKHGLATLATYKNIYMKLGGLGMEYFGFGWNKQAVPPDSTALAKVMTPYYLYCIEQFGVKRCMFESNFPVDKISYSYNILWNAFKRITQKFTRTERISLFHDTAAEVYRLPKWDLSNKIGNSFDTWN